MLLRPVGRLRRSPVRLLLSALLGGTVLLTAARFAVGPVVLPLSDEHGLHLSDVAAVLVATPPALMLWLLPVERLLDGPGVRRLRRARTLVRAEAHADTVTRR